MRQVVLRLVPWVGLTHHPVIDSLAIVQQVLVVDVVRQQVLDEPARVAISFLCGSNLIANGSVLLGCRPHIDFDRDQKTCGCKARYVLRFI